MQDFSKRIVIVVDPDLIGVDKNLKSWQVLNCVAHISAYLVGIFGDNEKVKVLTKKFSLWK